MAGSLVRDVVERHNNSSSFMAQQRSGDGSGGSSKTGFPAVQHRSKATSAFKRAKLDERVQSDLRASKDGLQTVEKPRDEAESLKGREPSPRTAENWMEDISRSNEEAVARMSEGERERERQDIVDRFGTGIDDLMSKVKEARKRRAAAAPGESSLKNVDFPDTSTSETVPPSPRARASRKIRFVEPTEADVHVYESQPSSPKRVLALLSSPPEDAQERRGISSLGTFNGSLDYGKALGKSAMPSSPPEERDIEPLEEGTPEDIRRRYFPTEALPEANPSLAWMLPSSTSSSKRSPSAYPKFTQTHDPDVALSLEPRYSLSGTRLSHSDINSLPTHLGLHHHASAASTDAPAGYTLSDLLLLARSSVPAQRASVLGVLAKILRVTREQTHGLGRISPSSTQEGVTAVSGYQPGVVDAMRRDVLDAAIDALGEKGGVGQRAVDALWEAIVGFEEYGAADSDWLAEVDLTPRSSPTTVSSNPVLQTLINATNSMHSSLPIIPSLPVGLLLPALTSHLLASSSPLSRTHVQVLDILHVFSHFSHHARMIVSPETGAGVIAALVGPHLRSSFDADENDLEETRATTKSIRILQLLTRSDRDNALKLTGTADVLLRYVTAPLPPLHPAHPQSDILSTSRHSLALLEETLRFYALLSRYGLYSQVASTAQDHFARLGAWLLEALRIVASPYLTTLARAYLSLLEIWMVCATDPHRTTPSHDILWSQVQGWNWGQWTIDIAELLVSTSGFIPPSDSSGLRNLRTEDPIVGLWTSVCQTAAVWLEGASINGIKGGEAERTLALARLGPIFEQSRGASVFIRIAVATLQDWELPRSLDVQSIGTLRDLSMAADLVDAALRLALACFGHTSAEQPLYLPANDIRRVCVQFVGVTSGRSPYAIVFGEREVEDTTEFVHAFLRPVSSLLMRQLQYWRRSMTHIGMDFSEGAADLDEAWATQALGVLSILLPGDEVYGIRILELMCNSIDAMFVQKVLPSTYVPNELWDKDGMKVLLPFLMHSLRPSNLADNEDGGQNRSTYIAPGSATPESVARCTTLNLPSFSRVRSTLKSIDESFVLPLRNDWPTLPLNHLLRSGTSPVFHALPPSWDATETDVVRACLLLVQIVQNVQCKRPFDASGRLGMSRAETIFACMKIFMLEHGQQQGDSGDEVFRDPLITQWMEDLLTPFTYSNLSPVRSYEAADEIQSSLEHVSKAFLGAKTPFYQFYTDFLALYDAISFSHPLFGRLLLPPVSMLYPIDYRKLLFGDFSHVLRTLKTTVQDVISGDIRDYLWPVERDAHVIGCYLKALITSNLQGFVRWFAVHHIAANIWPEFQDGDDGSQERAGKLLSAVLQQGSPEIVKDIALYRQPKQEVWLPPRCFLLNDKAWRERRFEWVDRISDQRRKTQLHSLLLD